MKTILTINIDLDKKCTRCKKAGATQSGLCMRCIAQGIIKGEYDHIFDPPKERLAEEKKS